MAQQTAVEWLEEKLKTYLSWSAFLEEDFEQAKQMEKEQILDAVEWGAVPPIFMERDPEVYYNKTYKP